MILGDTKILYIKDTTWKAVGCETSNSLSESIDIINSSQSGVTNGWVSFRTGAVGYEISFNGIVDEVASIGYFDLVALKRARTKVEWKIESGYDRYSQSGFGYISSVSESAPVGEFVSFSGQIMGYGNITSTQLENFDYILNMPI